MTGARHVQLGDRAHFTAVWVPQHSTASIEPPLVPLHLRRTLLTLGSEVALLHLATPEGAPLGVHGLRLLAGVGLRLHHGGGLCQIRPQPFHLGVGACQLGRVVRCPPPQLRLLPLRRRPVETTFAPDCSATHSYPRAWSHLHLFLCAASDASDAGCRGALP